jgi:hypothetical protein
VPLPAAILALLRKHAGDQAQVRERASQLRVDEGWIFATEIGAPINPESDWASSTVSTRGSAAVAGRIRNKLVISSSVIAETP